jgi:hypothetical protein
MPYTPSPSDLHSTVAVEKALGEAAIRIAVHRTMPSRQVRP